MCAASIEIHGGISTEYWMGDQRVFMTWCGECGWFGDVVRYEMVTLREAFDALQEPGWSWSFSLALGCPLGPWLGEQLQSNGRPRLQLAHFRRQSVDVPAAGARSLRSLVRNLSCSRNLLCLR